VAGDNEPPADRWNKANLGITVSSLAHPLLTRRPEQGLTQLRRAV